MKLKGISILEQHVEKFVLLIFALFAIGVFVTQFDVLGDPNAVKIDNDKVSPDKAVDVVKEKAQRFKGQMEDEGERVEPPSLAGPLKVVRDALGRPVSDSPMELSLAPAWSSESYANKSSTSTPDIRLGSPYLEVEPPAPTDVMARSFAGTIDPFEPLEHPELASYLPEEQPLDKRAVTVQATFDAAALRDMLATAPADESVNPLPTQWWQGRVELLDVELIRQEVGSDGATGPEETIGVMPGRFSLRDEIHSSETAPKDLPAILRSEADHREGIRRPAYYAMIMGEEWVWPAKASEGGEARPDAKEIQRLVSERRKAVHDRDDATKRLEAMKSAPPPSSGAPAPQPQRRSEAWPQIPATWLAQLPLPGGRPQPQPDGRQQSRDRAIQALEEKIKNLDARIAELDEQLKAKGVGPDGKPLDQGPIQPFSEALSSLTGPDGQASVTVWAHDITVEPGKSYRYKVRVWVTNPMFGHVADVPEGQHELAEKPAIASADSEWSNTVRAYPQRVFFVAGATEAASGDQLGLMRGASASVDVYEYYYGYWRGGSVSLDQGDVIRVDMTLPELPVFEVEKSDAGTPVVKGTTTLPTDRTVGEDAMLLEVGLGLAPGERGQVHEAIFGWLNDGGLEVRVAEEDAEGALVEEVWGSSEAAKTAEVGTPGQARSAQPGPRQEGRPGEGAPEGAPPGGGGPGRRTIGGG